MSETYTGVGPQMGTICQNDHPMEIQRYGNLYRINPDQSFEEIAGGALVDYEYISCTEDCPDIPSAIRSMSFDIVFNGQTCTCESGSAHDTGCALYIPGTSGQTMSVTITANGKTASFAFFASHPDEGQSVASDFEEALREHGETELDEITTYLNEQGWQMKIAP